MVTPVEYAMLTFVGKLISHIHAAVAKNATRHMQLNVWTDVVFLKRSACEFVTCSFATMFVAEILKVTFTGLVADWTIERVVDKKKFHNTVSCIDHALTGDVFYNHSIHHIGAAACNQLRHRPRISR